jgi:hypothetical protein
LAEDAQAEQSALAGDDFTTFILRAIITRYTRYVFGASSATSATSAGLNHGVESGGYALSTDDVINAAALELTPDSPITRADLSQNRVGRLLKRLRLNAGRGGAGTGSRRFARHWTLTRTHLERWSRAYGLPLPQPPPPAAT